MKKIIVIALILYSVATLGQYKKPYFNTLNVAAGLPESSVISSIQDNYGYLWLGTQNGLVRYDGYQLKSYAMPDDDGSDVVNVSVVYLFEDREGQLWVHIFGEGLYYLDRTIDKFIKQKWRDLRQDSAVLNSFEVKYWLEDKQPQTYWIKIQNSGDLSLKLLHFDALQNTLEEYSAAKKGRNNIPAVKTLDIKKDASSKMWIVADSLLSYFDAKSKSFKPYFVVPEKLNGAILKSFIADPIDPNVLWIITDDSNSTAGPNQGLNSTVLQFDTKTKKYKFFPPGNSTIGALPANGLQVYADELKRIWVSTEKGISLFDRNTGKFTNYHLSSAVISSAVIAADAAGNLWIGDCFKGIYFLDIKSGVATFYNQGNEPGDLPVDNCINKLFFDRSGTLWISTPFEGISFLDRQRSMFAPIPISQLATPKTSKEQVLKTTPFAICGHEGDSICFLNNTSSLYAWHIKTNKYDRIDLKNQDVYAKITSVVFGKDGALYVGSTNYGLFKYNRTTKLTIHYKQNLKDSLSLNSTNISVMTVDKEGILWIGTKDKGLYSFDEKTAGFTHYPFIINDGNLKAKNELDDKRINSLLLDSDGILWIGTNMGGLNRFDPKTRKFTSYLDWKKGFNCVISIFIDSHQRLWAGTYLSGLFLFDRQKETYKRYSVKDGLLYNDNRSITEDAAGNIWTFNERGMSRLNPSTNKITNYTEFKLEDARIRNFKDATGNFYFSTKKGIVSFNPMDLNDNIIPPAVVIESVSFHNSRSKRPTDVTLYTAGRKKITLTSNENKLIVRFVALHFANSLQNKYSYKLVGFDDDWVYSGTERTASYTNLSPGTYVFQVKAANSDGFWNETPASFTIVILSPWWATWWAYLLYAILIAGLIWTYTYYRSKVLKRKNLILEEKVSLRTKQLQKSLTNLKDTQSQLVQSEKMASLGELAAGIAHEIQNPLNFVNNFSEVSSELLDEMDLELGKGGIQEAKEIAIDVKQNLEKIIHHGKRADAIVKGMLQHSRSSAGIKGATDLNTLCDEYLRLSYHGLRAKDKSFNATTLTDFDESIGKIKIIQQDLGRVILNLLNNAFYAVNQKQHLNVENYKPTVSISTKKENDKIIIRITDNGCGMTAEVMAKIYQPFFTTKPTGEGTGLGLSMSYDIITNGHNGELKVESQENEGTTFSIILLNTVK